MPSVVHIVTTGSFAGVERYVCNTATELAGRDWDVTVVGGNAATMSGSLGSSVQWLPGATAGVALRSLAKLGRRDICHVHMSIAEAVGVAARPLHRAPVVSTRHFAARRGSVPFGRALAPLIAAGLAREIAVSEFVAKSTERRPDAVLVNGVLPSPCLWQPSSRVILVLARLAPEKDTLTALRAWQASQLWKEGWAMRVVGDGTQRPTLERWVRSRGLREVVFTGWASDVSSEFAQAGVLLAPAPLEPFGLVVLEAMAAGIPVVACAGGGHMETVGLIPDASVFPIGDSEAAAGALRAQLPEEVRRAASTAGRHLVETHFSVAGHVDRLLDEYQVVRLARRGVRAASVAPEGGSLKELVVCSLEDWDEVWRRNQFVTDMLLRRNPDLRILFVEPASDPLFELSQRRLPSTPRLRQVRADGRLTAFRPLKLLPRRLGPQTDAFLCVQVRLAARLSGFRRPTLWLNDVTYAPLIAATGWPSLYDITDDWLLAPASERELERLRRLDELALQRADEVVVCSTALAESRGVRRPVRLIPNAVDSEHFREPRPRPSDLPGPPVAVYAGSLHEARLDVALIRDVANALPHVAIALVGPDALEPSSRRALTELPNIRLLGAKPYRDVPAYLQHANVLIVPHRVTPFTDSLDPIKAYECVAVNKPTVATPVAGFRELHPLVTLASGDEFALAVAGALRSAAPVGLASALPSWEERAQEFEQVLRQCRPPRPR